MLADRRVVARQIDGRWLVDEASLPRTPRRSRPMSVANAWRLLIDGHELSGNQAYLRRRALGRLAGDAGPDRLLPPVG